MFQQVELLDFEVDGHADPAVLGDIALLGRDEAPELHCSQRGGVELITTTAFGSGSHRVCRWPAHAPAAALCLPNRDAAPAMGIPAPDSSGTHQCRLLQLKDHRH